MSITLAKIKRPPMSEAQKQKLRAAQKAYIASDPRWTAHRQKLADAQRRPTQRARLSVTTKTYIDTDPRWPDHRARMQAAAQAAVRLTLIPQEIERIAELRRKGRTFEYLSEEFCVSEKVMRRELRESGIDTSRVKPDRRARKGPGFWRSFNESPAAYRLSEILSRDYRQE